VKLVTFASTTQPRTPRLGALVGEVVVDLLVARTWAQGARSLVPEDLPGSMIELLYAGPPAWAYLRKLVEALSGEDPLHLKGANRLPVGFPLDQVLLYPPLPRPNSLRDFYAFEAHVKAAFANRGKEIPPEWYQLPVFYFSNPNAVFASGEPVPYPAASQALDFELEVAAVIGKAGINISPEEAEDYIFGYTIFNDWSARDIQQVETRVGLGPAKAKDFAFSLGPAIITPDELTDRATGRPGIYQLEMVARVNGNQCSRGDWQDMHYSFGELIARASADVLLLPGDVIGSGTVGSGCLLELTAGQGPWLKPGDSVELEIERFGVLANRISPRPQPSR
jgi:fumarylacetoacetate (FAA) hydrolase